MVSQHYCYNVQEISRKTTSDTLLRFSGKGNIFWSLKKRNDLPYSQGGGDLSICYKLHTHLSNLSCLQDNGIDFQKNKTHYVARGIRPAYGHSTWLPSGKKLATRATTAHWMGTETEFQSFNRICDTPWLCPRIRQSSSWYGVSQIKQTRHHR